MLVLIILTACIKNQSSPEQQQPKEETSNPPNNKPAPLPSPHLVEDTQLFISGRAYTQIQIPETNETLETFFSNDINNLSEEEQSAYLCTYSPYKVYQVGSGSTIVSSGSTDVTGSFSSWISDSKEVLIEFEECSLRCLAKPGDSDIKCDPIADAVLNYIEHQNDLSLLDTSLANIQLANLLLSTSEIIRIEMGKRYDYQLSSQLAICRKSPQKQNCLIELMEISSIKSIYPLIELKIQKNLLINKGVTLHDTAAFSDLVSIPKIIELLAGMAINLVIPLDKYENLDPHDDQVNFLSKLIERQFTFSNASLLCQSSIVHPNLYTIRHSYYQPRILNFDDWKEKPLASVCPSALPNNDSIKSKNTIDPTTHLLIASDLNESFSNHLPLNTLEFNYQFLEKISQDISNTSPTYFSPSKVIELLEGITSKNLIEKVDLPWQSYPPSIADIHQLFFQTNKSLLWNITQRTNYSNVLAINPNFDRNRYAPVYCDIPDLMGNTLKSGRINCSKNDDYQFEYDKTPPKKGSPNTFLLARGLYSLSYQNLYQLIRKNGLPLQINHRPLMVTDNLEICDKENSPPQEPTHQEPMHQEPTPQELTIMQKSWDGTTINQDVLVLCHDFSSYQMKKKSPIKGPMISINHQEKQYNLPTLIHTNGTTQLIDDQQICLYTSKQALYKNIIDYSSFQFKECVDNKEKESLTSFELNSEPPHQKSSDYQKFYLAIIPSDQERTSYIAIPIDSTLFTPITRKVKSKTIQNEYQEHFASVLTIPLSVIKKLNSGFLLIDTQHKHTLFYHQENTNYRHPFYDDLDNNQEWSCNWPSERIENENLDEEATCKLYKSTMEKSFYTVPPDLLKLLNELPHLAGSVLTEISLEQPTESILKKYWTTGLSCLNGNKPTFIDINNIKGNKHGCDGEYDGEDKTLRIRNLKAKYNGPLIITPKSTTVQLLYTFKEHALLKQIIPEQQQFNFLEIVSLYISYTSFLSSHYYRANDPPPTICIYQENNPNCQSIPSITDNLIQKLSIN